MGRHSAFQALQALSESVVKRRPENCCYKMGEVRSTFVELKVARHTVVGEIFCYAGFGDA
jgi:hypothetical protein